MWVFFASNFYGKLLLIYWFFFVIVAHLLRVTPNEAIIFTKVENELYGQVQLTNIDLNPVTYKVSFEI